MSNPDLIKNYDAGAAIAPYRIAKFGASDGEVVQAAAAGDALMGVVISPRARETGDRVDVVRSGLAPVEYGGNVTRGDLLTSDANGAAITAAPSAGANMRVIGTAEVSGVAGDIGEVMIGAGEVQGA